MLPRAGAAQARMGVSVKPAELQAGDLVFFKNTYKRGISHVGLYVGNDYFIHAARPGKGVCLSRLSDPYNRSHWYGARRLDLSKLPPVPGEKLRPEDVIVEDDPKIEPPADLPPHGIR